MPCAGRMSRLPGDYPSGPPAGTIEFVEEFGPHHRPPRVLQLLYRRRSYRQDPPTRQSGRVSIAETDSGDNRPGTRYTYAVSGGIRDETVLRPFSRTMTIASFFNSWLGMYLAQSFLHSLIAAFIVDTALLAWKIESPVVRQRFRLLVVVMPIAAYPVYQAMSWDRGSALFRLDAVFNINRWLNIDLWNTVPLGVLFLLLLAFSAAVFVIQELVPIMRHSSEGGLEARDPSPGSAVNLALESLPGPHPRVQILDEQDPVIFSSTGRDPAVYVSEGLVRALSRDELRAALAHEIGHIRRSRRPLMVLVFLLRVVMFYNPVILMEFRRIAQEEEKICDDLAVALTGDRTGMAGALLKLFREDADGRETPAGESARIQDRIEEYSHSLLIESRLTRLQEPAAPDAGGAGAFLIVLATVAAVNFYVV